MAAAAAAAAVPSTSTTLLCRYIPSPPLSSLRLPPPFFTLPLPVFTISAASISITASHSVATLSSLSRPKWPLRTLAVAEEEEKAVVEDEKESDSGEDGALSDEGRTPRTRPCELYVCNLPRSCDISQLLDLFKPFGTVLSVEVSRDSETGISRGCGYVTMSSAPEAKAAIDALDGSDLVGREMRVKYSVDMVSGRKNTEALHTAPKTDLVFESPHKVYVGNLAWSVRPENLREHFSQFGTVVSARLLYDRKGGRNRVYGFLSFSTATELKAAMEIDGSVFHGRTLLVREVMNRE